MPFVPIRRKNTVPQERLPFLVENGTFPEITKLCRQDGLDVLRISSEDGAAVHGAQFRGEAAGAAVLFRVSAAEVKEVVPFFEVLVVDGRLDHAVDDIESPGQLCGHIGSARPDGADAGVFLPSFDVGGDDLGDDEEGQDASEGYTLPKDLDETHFCVAIVVERLVY